MRRVRVVLAGVLALVGVAAAIGPAAAFDETWTRVGTGTTGGVSGLAPTSTGWLVARDNKKAGQNRISLLSDSGAVTPLTWPGTEPQDLEALSAVPGTSSYAALTSAGAGSIFTVSGSRVSVQRTFQVPKGTANIEALSLTQVQSTVVAVWATRGSQTNPAKVFAATFTPASAAFGRVVTAKVTVPYPTTNLRVISDLVVRNGRMVISSASDPGVNGPFSSAVYDIGTVGVSSGRAVLSTTSPRSLGTFAGHKIEGLACSGTTGLMGSDDEKQGGWVRTGAFCD